MITHRQIMDLRHGMLERINRHRDGAGPTIWITSLQLHCLGDPQVAALEVTVEDEDWSGGLIVECAVNGAVSNRNVIADRGGQRALGADGVRRAGCGHGALRGGQDPVRDPGGPGRPHPGRSGACTGRTAVVRRPGAIQYGARDHRDVAPPGDL